MIIFFETVPFLLGIWYLNVRGGKHPEINMDPKDHVLEKDFSIGTVGITLVKLSRPHTTSPQKVPEEGKSPYFRKI